MTCALISLVDKASGKELVSGDSGCFQYVVEDYPKSSDSAWRVGPAISKQNINRMGTVRVTDYVGAQGNYTEGYSVTPNDTTPVRTFQHCRGGIRCLLSYTASFHASDLSVTVTLDSGSKYLTYDVSVNWIQRGSHAGMPALRFLAQPGYHSTQFRYTTADGTLIRPELIHDVPSLGSMEYLGDGAMLHLFTAYKYGFRGWKDNSGVNLIRSSINPDPHPDLGLHRFQLHLGAAEDAVDAYRQRTAAAHSLLAVSAGSHSGELPMAGQLLELKTDAKVSALYVTDSGAVAARLFNDSKTAVGIDNAPPYVRCNTLERPEDTENASSIAPYSYATILLK